MMSKRKRRSSPKSKKKSEQLPHDLIIEILSKLPAKSIAKCLCVSREWLSNLRSLNFSNLFMTVSSSHPRLLFSVQTKGNKLLFLSSPQPLNGDNNSSALIVDSHMSFPLITTGCPSVLHAPVNGLMVRTANVYKRGIHDSKVMIYNPSSGQSVRLPINREQRDRKANAITFLGYDPIDKQHKVLCIDNKHTVLTLEIQKPAWRMIESSLPYHYPYSPICMNGVLYYLGRSNHLGRSLLVCFDVRSERIIFMETIDKVRSSRLINYKGKLGLLPHLFDGKSIELLILDDVEKNEWSQHIYVLPPLWKDLAADMAVVIVGMTSNGELVFSSFVYDRFYIFFYNLEKSTIVRVRIQDTNFRWIRFIQTFVGHVENVKLM